MLEPLTKENAFNPKKYIVRTNINRPILPKQIRKYNWRENPIVKKLVGLPQLKTINGLIINNAYEANKSEESRIKNRIKRRKE